MKPIKAVSQSLGYACYINLNAVNDFEMRKLHAQEQQQKNQFLGADFNQNAKGETPQPKPCLSGCMKFITAS